ncbi:MAG TPA: hypothetical protein DCF91_03300, partial [Porphyromonadaceae bacterium]|nr:hypothetical protein [Porphyromonadaceae bacterium]
MKRNFALCILSAGLLSTSLSLVSAQDLKEKSIVLSPKAKEILNNKKILFIEREQYAPDHHNTETLFQKGEINEDSFRPGSAMRIWDVNTNEIKTLISL